ncbi:MAG: HEAT repeat domain-containing protein [Deltaproteobacteria bacterium]|nr:HEAT repeat domain-containing protein [Deltaproteobacteria bacterium]
MKVFEDYNKILGRIWHEIIIVSLVLFLFFPRVNDAEDKKIYDVDEYIEQLRSGSTEEKVLAANALERTVTINEKNQSAITALFENVFHENNEVRYAAQSALGEIATGDQTTISKLLNIIISEEGFEKKIEAIKILSFIAEGHRLAIDTVFHLVTDDNLNIRSGAKETFQYIAKNDDKSIKSLIEKLSHENIEIIQSSSEMLSDIAPENDKAINAIIQLLSHKDGRVRVTAAGALSGMAWGHRAAIEALIRTLSDADSAVRIGAAITLNNIARGNEQAINALTKALDDHDVRTYAATALSHITSRGHNKKVVQALISALAKEASDSAIIAALGDLSTGDEASINALLALLNNKVGDTYKIEALYSLSQIAHGNLPTIQSLIELISSDDNDEVKAEAILCLGRVGVKNDTQIIDVLINFLLNKNLLLRKKAAASLSNIVINNESVVQTLMRLLSNVEIDKDFRTTIISALIQMGQVDILLSTYSENDIADEIAEYFIGDTYSATSDKQISKQELQKLIIQNHTGVIDNHALTKMLRTLAEKPQDWIRGSFLYSTCGTYSVMNLVYFFIAKTAPFCSKNSDEMMKNLVDTIQGINRPKVGDLFYKLATFTDELFQADFDSNIQNIIDKIDDGRNDQIYSFVFFKLLMHELLRQNRIQSSPRITKIMSNINKMLTLVIEDMRDGYGMAYALASGYLALGDSTQDLRILRSFFDAKNSLEVKYNTSSGLWSKSLRGSAGRAPIVHLALYILDGKKEKDRDNLKKSLHNYSVHLLSLMSHLTKENQHTGDDALAPYFFYSTLPYVTAALRLLMNENKESEKEELLNLQLKFRKAFLNVKNGLFYDKNYDGGRAYINPLMGLAIIPLLDENAASDKITTGTDYLGILRQD